MTGQTSGDGIFLILQNVYVYLILRSLFCPLPFVFRYVTVSHRHIRLVYRQNVTYNRQNKVAIVRIGFVHFNKYFRSIVPRIIRAICSPYTFRSRACNHPNKGKFQIDPHWPLALTSLHFLGGTLGICYKCN